MTPHQKRVTKFNIMAGQIPPKEATVRDVKDRMLRANLILEEAIEAVDALGFGIFVSTGRPEMQRIEYNDVQIKQIENKEVNLAHVLKELADVSVVTNGTATALGCDLSPVLKAVDENNLAKFGPGHKINELGKLIKPPDFKGVDVTKFIKPLPEL